MGRASFISAMVALVACGGDGKSSGDATSACPAPGTPGSTASLCGSVIDIASQLSSDASAGCELCDTSSDDGVCDLAIAAYDPNALASDPQEAAPLNVGEISLDSCGRYRMLDVSVPFVGSIAIAVSGSEHRLTATAYHRLAAGEVRNDTVAYATTKAADVQWTASAGNPFGTATFADTGVAVALYRSGGEPLSGVMATADGTALPENTYYFADDGDTLTTVDPEASATGANGAALLVQTGLQSHSGAGNQPDGCEWPTESAASIAGMVWVTEFSPHALDDPTEPCEP